MYLMVDGAVVYCSSAIVPAMAQLHCKEISIYVFPEKNCAASVLISILCVRERFIYSHDRSIYIACSRIGRPIVGINKSHTGTCM
jgi:hypothetical protein